MSHLHKRGIVKSIRPTYKMSYALTRIFSSDSFFVFENGISKTLIFNGSFLSIPKICTIENENDCQISFLDVEIICELGEFLTSLHHEPTFSGITHFSILLPLRGTANRNHLYFCSHECGLTFSVS